MTRIFRLKRATQKSSRPVAGLRIRWLRSRRGWSSPPLLLFGLFFVVLGDEVNSVGNWRFWASVVGGSVLAALAVHPFKKLPLWAAFIAGPAVVLVLVAVGVAVYALTKA